MEKPLPSDQSPKLLFLDCDNTLSGIEGVDEIANRRPPTVAETVARQTQEAMEGKIPLDKVYGQRLEIIRPTLEECLATGRLYIDHRAPHLETALREIVTAGWRPIILSGGFLQAIEPFAQFLGIADIEAVPLQFDSEGNYLRYDQGYPTTRNHGKTEIIERWRQRIRPQSIAMVGDGVSDLETLCAVDLFVGFGGFAIREKVQREAPHFIRDFSQLLPLLKKPS